jgi:cytochrome c biogenesis protein CcdA
MAYEEKYKVKNPYYPIIFMEGRFLSLEKVERYIDSFFEYVLTQQPQQKEVFSLQEFIAKIDLVSRFKSFRPLAIVFAGLVDGINPCAFTVIVFFITFLSFQGYRKREIAFTGIYFILAVFLAYLLLGIGLFNFLYRLKIFSYVLRIVYALIALLCFILGMLTVYDILRFKKTNKAEDMVLKLPEKIKYYIHRFIGLHYRKTQKENTSKKGLSALVLSAIILGFGISFLEAVCTGQLYLPTIAFVLKTTNLKLQALAYLVLYNLMFIAPLIIVFLFALLGVSSEQFSRFMQRHMVLIKILMAGLFFGLGEILIFNF